MISPSLKTVYAVALTLVLVSCAKHISYHDAYKFDWHTYKPKAPVATDTIRSGPTPTPAEVFASNDIQDVAVVKSYPIRSASPPVFQPYRQQADTTIVKESPNNGAQKWYQKGDRKLNWTAAAGIIMGLMIFPAFLGVIFSIVALKSEEKLLAILGLIISVTVSIGLIYLLATEQCFNC